MPILIPYNQLSLEQQDIVRRVSRGDKNLYVEGPAGSGKTLISLYALKNFVESESGKILFLMYNYSLYGYLKTALTELDIINGLTIATKDKFFWDLAKFDNYYPPFELSFEAKHSSIMHHILSTETEQEFDIIVVDEVQDISSDEFEMIKRLGKKIITLGDFNQGIYKTDMSQEKMLTLGDHESLTTVFRYHIEIAKIAKNFSDRDLPSMVKTGNGVKPRLIDIPENQLFPEIAEILKNLAVRRKRVGVISPDKDKLKMLNSYLNANAIENVYYSENKDFRNHDFSTYTPLLLSSFSAKGLEFENVIVFGFNRYSSVINNLINKNLLKEIIFVSITRCNSDLFILRTPDEVEQIKNLKAEESNEAAELDLGDLLDDLF